MGKESNRLVLGASSVALLFFLFFLYAAIFTSDVTPFDSLGKHSLSDWDRSLRSRKIDKGKEVAKPLEFLLRRLVRGFLFIFSINMISFLNLLSNTTQDIVDISFLYRPRFTQYGLMLVFSLPNQCKSLNLPTGEDRAQLETTGFSCHSDLHSEVCITNKPAIVDNSALTTYLQSSGVQVKHMVRPYARKEDETAMKQVTPVLILAGNVSSPACHFNHDVPAVVFSSGGFTGNLFHEFNEVIIPLFITCRQFQSHLQFVISDFKPLWVRKYNRILTHLSRFEVINSATDRSVRCFPAAVIGLKYHENLAVNSTEIPGGYSMFDFKNFLRESYNLKTQTVSDIEKPVLVLISRRKTRTFLNEDEMVGIIEELGFQAIVAKPNRMSNMDKFARVINSCSVMVGAHGAGLANAVFLPAGAVMVQVVPLGLDWASKAYYGDPAGEMGVHYMEYKIEPEESSLFKEYGPHHPVIADPMSIFLQGYNAARAVYVDGQNLTINLVRFRETLNKAMKFLVH